MCWDAKYCPGFEIESKEKKRELRKKPSRWKETVENEGRPGRRRKGRASERASEWNEVTNGRTVDVVGAIYHQLEELAPPP